MKTASRAHVCTPQTPAEYIKGLPAWDRVPRAGQWLLHAVEGGSSEGWHQSPRMRHLSITGYQWLLGMVDRALNPGTMLDGCLVLEGPAGTGKSSLLRALAGKDFFSDRAISMETGAATQEEMDRVWLYEIAELNDFSSADKQHIKAFITARADVYRPLYTKEFKSAPRQFVVAATATDNAWRVGKAVDPRFWVVIVPTRIDIQWLLAHRDQLFAEALLRLRQGAAREVPYSVADFHSWSNGGAE